MFSVRPSSAAFSDSDDDDENSKSAAPSLPPGVVAPPPHGAYESRLWSRMNEVLPDKSSVMAVRGVDFGSHRYQLLHHEIDDIVRTKGRMNHTELVCLEDPTSREETPMSSPRTTTGEANGVGGGAAKKVSPTHASAKRVLHPRKQRYLAMKTVAYEAYTPNIYKSNGKAVNDSANFASFRFSFITLFFVGVACGKFKRLLRRRTLAEQQERYGEMLTKSVAARLEHINKPEAKGYSIRSARDLVQRTTREGTAKFNLAIKNSNEMARRVRLNPRAALTARNNAADSSSVDALQQSLPIVTPGTTIRLGDFLVNNNNLNLPFITATTGIHGRNGSLEESATGFGAAPVGGGGGGGGIVPVLDISASQIMGSPFNVTNNNRSGGQRPGFLSHQQSPRPVRGASTATALENSPRFGSFYQNEAPSLASTVRVIPAFELFSDANVFVTNLQWEEMEYVPLSERSKKTLVLQRQVRESDLQKFTQTIVPASSKRIQESSTSAAKKPPSDGPAVADSPNKNSARNGASGSESSGGGPTDQSRQHQLGLVSSHTSFSRHKDAPPAPAQDLTQAQKTAMLQLLALQQANLDINLKGAAVYEPGKKSMARSDNSVSGIRATRSIARPDPSVPFNFYSWRSKQNRALFHHLCQEHRELMLETAAAVAGGMTSAGSGGGTQPQPPPPPPGNGFEFNMSANAAFSGESPGDPQLTPREPNGGGLSQKELQALRERVRRRAEEVEFNDRDSASTTYGAFLVHKNVEHADFLKRSMAEVERLLATKEALSRVPKRAQLLESIDHQHESGIFLAERFLESVAKLDDGIRQNLKNSIIEENAVYNRGWILTLRGRLQMSFGGEIPQELMRVMTLAEQTAARCSHRDLTLKDLEDGVVAELTETEALSPAAQFGLERLLPAFSSTEKVKEQPNSQAADPILAQLSMPIPGIDARGQPTVTCAPPAPPPVTPKDILRQMFAKIQIPFVLLSEEDEKEHKELFGLSVADKTRYTNWKELRSIGKLNTVMEPHFEKLALAALNSVEARHTAMRMEHKKMLEQMGKAEENALLKAASLERRNTKRLSIAVGLGNGLDGDAPLSGRRHSSNVVMYPMPLGMDSISPTMERARAVRRESLANSSDTTTTASPLSAASPRKGSVAPLRSNQGSGSNFFTAATVGKSEVPKLPVLPSPTIPSLDRRSSRVVTMMPHPPPPQQSSATFGGKGDSPSKRTGSHPRPFFTPTGVTSPPNAVVAEPVGAA